MLYHVTIDERTYQVELDGGRIMLDGEELANTGLVAVPGTAVRHLLLDGRSVKVVAHHGEEGWSLNVDGWPVHAEVVDERTRAIRTMTGAAAGPQGPKPVRAPMPGLIVRVEVSPGDSVNAAQPVVVMEAMKMENELRAEAAGTVSRVLVEAGQAVERNAVLVEFDVEGA